MATNIKRHTQYYSGNGVPKSGDAFSSLNLYAHYFDRDTSRTSKTWYIYMGSGQWIVDPELTGTTFAPPTVSVGTTTTLPAGSTATVADADPSGNVVLNFGIPKGQDGVSGSGGLGGYIVLTPNGVDDTAQWQNAINTSYQTGQGIVAYGIHRFSSGVKIQKDHKFLSINGWFEARAINTNEFTFFYSDAPVDTAEAEGVYTRRKLSFSNIVFQGNGNKQTAFDLYATEGAKYDHIWGYDLKRHLDLTFALRNEVNFCEATNCIDGIILRSGSGRWGNATTSNSCSNGTVLNSPRVYGHQIISVTGIGVYDTSNVEINNPILEGWKFTNAGIDYQSMSSTATGADIKKPHFECANPCTAIKLRSSTMIHIITAPNFIKPGVYVAVDGAGYPQVNIRDASNQRIYFDGATKIFKHFPGTSWKFTNCDNPINATDLPKMFDGTVSQGCGTGAGANKWCIENPINR